VPFSSASTAARPPRSSSPSSSSRGGGRRRPGSQSRPARVAPTPVVTRAPQPPVTSFAAAGLSPSLVTALARRGVETPFPIQAAALRDALAGTDVLGRAATGSGKTLAFGLALLARVEGEPRVPRRPRALVLVPTRELAKQVADVLIPLGQAVNIRVTTVYGGAPLGRQIDALGRGVDVVVATPGRLEDLLERRSVSLDAIEVTVLDEADHLCDLGFLPAMRRLLALIPAGTQRMLFSATLDGDVDTLVRQHLTEPVLVDVAPLTQRADATPVEHRIVAVRSREDKPSVAAGLVTGSDRALLFVRTKHGADRLALQLDRLGVHAKALHGGLAQHARTRALAAFTSGEHPVLVATDVAARGLHVDDVALVVHVDPPAEAKTFAHRSGRTGRAGAGGTVISLVLPDERRAVDALHRDAGVVPVAAA